MILENAGKAVTVYQVKIVPFMVNGKFHAREIETFSSARTTSQQET